MAKKTSRDGLTVNVKTAKGRKGSSTKWLRRQLNDPFVDEARKHGYRSRAVYKLTEIDDKYHFLKPGSIIVDLGCAPGSWCQVAVERTKGKATIIGLDLQEVEPIEGVEFLVGDFMEEEILLLLEEKLEGKKVDVVMSDMAAASCGHSQTDHIRIMALCEVAADFAFDWLREGGAFVAKVLRGGTEQELLKSLRYHFTHVKHIKPKASRQDSSEIFVVATGFRARED